MTQETISRRGGEFEGHSAPLPSASPLSLASAGGGANAGTVLVVDDDADTRSLIARWLSRANMTCIEASSGEQAIELARANADVVDAIVSDVMMDGLDGFEVVRRLQRIPATARIPVVMMTATATRDSDIVRGVETGAVDYMAKPVSPPVIVAKLRAACERTRAERQLRKQLLYAESNAMTDALTGLYNRWHLDLRLKEESARSRRHGEPFALVMLDLDHFKRINDTYGHAEGDRVLVYFAGAMRSVLRRDDVAFRYGGEEFILLLRGCDAEQAAGVTNRLREELEATPVVIPGHGPLKVTFSGGIAVGDVGSDYSHEDIVRRADRALYRAKNAGRNRVALATET